jgi:hypothetical protein
MSNIIRQNWLLDRRSFLRGVGATMALPLLDAMVPIYAKATTTAKPARSVFIYIPNGVNVLTWQITKAGRDFEFSQGMKPLQKHRENITIFSGLHHPNGIGQAHSCIDTWLTTAKINQSLGPVYRNSISCDQVIAEVTGKETRIPSLELSVSSGIGKPFGTTTLAFSRDGVHLPAEENPRVVFNRLFSVEGATSNEDQRRRLAQQRSVLDAVLSDANTLRMTLGKDDRTKLDEYLHSVREVEQRTERIESWLDAPKPKLDKKEVAFFQRNVTQAEAGEYYRTMFELIVLALRTDTTRVATYATGSENKGLAIPEIGIKHTRHELSHHNNDPAVMEVLTKSDIFLSQQFAWFLDRLQAVNDGDEPLLQRTMVLYGSGMSYGHSHQTANIPTILAGGQALGLKHGQHIDYNLPKIGQYDLTDHNTYLPVCRKPMDDKARMSNLLLTMQQCMGVRTDRFADSLNPISEVLA